jgi:hypothetical protein
MLHRLRQEYTGRIDPIVFEALLALCPPFPPGSRVGLSDGTRAVVTVHNSDEPYKPIVRKLEADGWSMQPGPLNLAKPRMPHIISIGGKPIAPLIPAPLVLDEHRPKPLRNSA